MRRRCLNRRFNRAQTILTTITIPSNGWHVGDAAGLDALIRDYNPEATVHRIQVRNALRRKHLNSIQVNGEGNQSWHFAERSQRMVDAVGAGGVLYAFPNKPCPPRCTPNQPFSGHGSGTWGTIAYAKKKGLDIELCPLITLETPNWLRQLSLF